MTEQIPKAPRGRGAASEPANRFTGIHVERDLPVAADPDQPHPATRVFDDASRSVIARNQSPDVGFDASLNPYRGCEHGCSYCYARPSHEYLGLSAGLDFETKIFAKREAPELLRTELASPSWDPQVLALSGVTDPYQPLERSLRITRHCLEVLAEALNPVAVITKSHLVTRDTDLLGELAGYGAAGAALSITTLNPDLQRRLEPRATSPTRRLEAIRQLSEAGVPVAVAVAPVIPGLTDREIPAILAAASEAGASAAFCVLLRLPWGVAGLFEAWLARECPERRDKVLNRLRGMHGGSLYDSSFGSRQRGRGPVAHQIRDLFRIARRRHGLASRLPRLETRHFRPPRTGPQLGLFEPGPLQGPGGGGPAAT